MSIPNHSATIELFLVCLPKSSSMLLLTSAEAVCASAFVSGAFVGVLYALPAPIAALRRDDPRQIKARMAAICVATLLAAAVVAGLIVGREAGSGGGGGGGGGGGAGSRLVAWMGLGLLDATAVSACARSLLLSATLFLGALCAEALELASLRTHWLAHDGSLRPRASGPLPWAELARTFQAYALVAPAPPAPPAKADGQPAAAAAAAAAAVEARRWSALRNLVAAPLTEELVFRAAVCPLLLAAGWAAPRVALVAPLFFGVAHVHHGVVAWRSGAASAAAAAVQVAVQMTYTWAFGVFAAFVFVRTGRVAPAVASHAFCNYMGLPHIGFLWADHHLHRHRRALLAAYAVGIGAFFWGLHPLTEGFGPLPWDNASAASPVAVAVAAVVVAAVAAASLLV
jgi:membrane protease YdiL (CAAX protease family)